MCSLLLSLHSRPQLRGLHGCEWVTGLAGPLLPPFISSINPPIYPSRLWPSQAPCWCSGWLGWPCCLWTGLRAAGPSSPPELRAWGVASRETAGTSGPTLSSSWQTTRMLSWVRLACSLVFLEFYGLCLLFICVWFFFLTFSNISYGNFISFS